MSLVDHGRLSAELVAACSALLPGLPASCYCCAKQHAADLYALLHEQSQCFHAVDWKLLSKSSRHSHMISNLGIGKKGCVLLPG